MEACPFKHPPCPAMLMAMMVAFMGRKVACAIAFLLAATFARPASAVDESRLDLRSPIAVGGGALASTLILFWAARFSKSSQPENGRCLTPDGHLSRQHRRALFVLVHAHRADDIGGNLARCGGIPTGLSGVAMDAWRWSWPGVRHRLPSHRCGQTLVHRCASRSDLGMRGQPGCAHDSAAVENTGQ
jgi:hypothetical protein